VIFGDAEGNIFVFDLEEKSESKKSVPYIFACKDELIADFVTSYDLKSNKIIIRTLIFGNSLKEIEFDCEKVNFPKNFSLIKVKKEMKTRRKMTCREKQIGIANRLMVLENSEEREEFFILFGTHLVIFKAPSLMTFE
jgi:hypothetical protein